MPASDNVVMRIVIQDDGKAPPVSRPQTNAPIPQGSSSSFAFADPAYYLSQPRPGPSVEQVLSQPATRRAQDASAAKQVERKAPANELIDLAAQYAGINQRHLQAVRDYFTPAAKVEPEVKAPEILKVNQPVTPKGGFAPTINYPGFPFQQKVPTITPGGTGPPLVPPVGPGGGAAGPTPAPGTPGMSLLAAGGIAGALYAAVKLVENKIGEAGENVRKRIDTAADFSRKVVNNDAAGAAGAGLNSAASMAEVMPIQGKIIGETYRTMGKFIEAVDGTAKSVIERGRELARYSPELAAASARQDVRTLQADIREAQHFGGAYSRVSDSYSELTVFLRELLLPIKEFLLNTLATTLSDIKAVLEVVMPWIRTIVEVVTSINEFGNWWRNMLLNAIPGFKELMTFIDLVKKYFAKNKQDEMPDTLKQFFSLLDAGHMPGFVSKRPDKFAEQKLNIPAFGGL